MHLFCMIKRVLGALVLLIVLLGAVIAANDSNFSVPATTDIKVTTTTGSADKGYTCLDGEVKNRSSFTFEEAVFGTMALGYRDALDQVITTAKSPSDNCWPNSGCKIKETAQVGLAYVQSGKDTAGIEQWLSSKNLSTTELQWYLEVDIDNHGTAKCSVTYDGTKKNFEVLSDMGLSGGAGNCLTVSSNGYWLRINNACLDKKFEISCDQDFVSSLIYQKVSGSTIYVSPNTHSASSSGTTEEQVNSKCFKVGGNCDYEGTLWASLFFQKKGKDTKAYTPYLSAYASDNEKYFPSSFLYILTSGDEQYTRIIQLQKKANFWELTSSPYNKFYDTSVALMSISGGSSSEAEAAKSYLLSVQGKNGCWDKLRDTAFILYSGWYRRGSGSPGGTSALCEEVPGQSCGTETQCLDAGGSVRSLFECSSPFESCCSVEIPTISCSEAGGKICSSGLECSGRITSSSDGSCCMEDCVEVQNQGPECTDSCQYSCSTGEVEVSGTCSDSGKICCAPEQKGGGSLTWLWIILLMLLIILVIIAIIFKDRIKVWWYKRKGKSGTNTTTNNRPVSPGPGSAMMQRPMMPRPVVQRVPARTIRPAIPARPVKKAGESDMEDTLRKLREMTK